MPSSFGIQWIDILGDNWSGPLRVRVRGGSMYPALRPGDVVLVEPAGPDDLRPGNVVLLRSDNGALLHRFLGRTPQGWLLTQGDAFISPDPPWPPEALLGKAVGREHRGRVVPIPNPSLCSAIRQGFRRAGGFLRLIRRMLAALLLALLLPTLAQAAVTLVSFTAVPQGRAIRVQWETASEVDLLGFKAWRAESERGGRAPISDLIPAVGDIVGASYRFTDTNVVPGRTYLYWLEAVEVTGASEFYGPVSAMVPLPSTPTPTPPPTWTPTATPTPTPPARVSPAATPTLTATPTATPTAAPVPTLIPSPMPYPSPSPATTQTPSPTASPTSAPSPAPIVRLSGATLAPSLPPAFTQAPSPTATTPIFIPSPSPASPRLSSPVLPSAGVSPSPERKPRPTRAPSPASQPIGSMWALLVAGGATGGCLVFWGLFSILRRRRPD